MATRRWLMIVLLIGSVMPTLASPEADRKAFVTTYIRHIADFESVRQKAESDKDPNAQQKIVSCVRNMTSFQLELNSQAQEIGGFKLQGEFKDYPSLLQMAYTKKSDLYGQMGKLCETFLRQQKPGFDYGSLSASAPKINAELDFNDRAMFRVSPAVALMLVDSKRLTHGKLEHLIVTKVERADLLASIKSVPGIGVKNPKYGPASAKMIGALLGGKGYKSADEP